MNDIQQEQQQPAESKKGNPPKYRNAIDQISRRDRRASLRTKFNNDRKPKNSGFLNMSTAWDGSPVFFPKKTKLKGWQKNLKQNNK